MIGALPCDIVVAADVLYDEECVIPLLQTLLDVTQICTDVLMASSHRATTLDAKTSFFNSVAGNFNIVDETVASFDADVLQSSGIVILRLSRKK